MGVGGLSRLLRSHNRGHVCEFCIPCVEQIQCFNVSHILTAWGVNIPSLKFCGIIFKIAGEVNVSLWVLIDKEGLKWFSFVLVSFHICSSIFSKEQVLLEWNPQSNPLHPQNPLRMVLQRHLVCRFYRIKPPTLVLAVNTLHEQMEFGHCMNDKGEACTWVMCSIHAKHWFLNQAGHKPFNLTILDLSLDISAPLSVLLLWWSRNQSGPGPCEHWCVSLHVKEPLSLYRPVFLLMHPVSCVSPPCSSYGANTILAKAT